MGREEFHLVLEGFAESSTDSLRRVKGTLLADLGLSVAEAQTILDSLPFTLFSAADEGALEELYMLLVGAGAKVHIVRPKGCPPDQRDEAIDFHLESEPSEGEHPSSPEETELVETELDFFVDAAPTPPTTESTPASWPSPEPLATDFSLELGAPPDLPPLKETVVEEAVSFDTFAPPEKEAMPGTVTSPPPASSAPELPSVLVSTVVPTSNPMPALGTRVLESPHNLPIGRRMRPASLASEELESMIHREGDLAGTRSSATITPATIRILVGGIVLLGFVNWLLYRW